MCVFYEVVFVLVLFGAYFLFFSDARVVYSVNVLTFPFFAGLFLTVISAVSTNRIVAAASYLLVGFMGLVGDSVGACVEFLYFTHNQAS